MPRVTVYVPDDLKARMDEVGEAVNWSDAAQRAFREAAAIATIRKDRSDMTSVVERLRASKERIEAAAHESGKDCGVTWAKQSAEYDELLRISKWEQDTLDACDLNTLTQLIDPNDEMDRHDWEAFWEQRGDANLTDAFAAGFVVGAVEVFNEVADEV
jgi:hypothetical protein